MRIKQIRDMLAKAIADEFQTGRLAALVEQTARQRGMSPPTAEAVQSVVTFVREYVSHVPLLLEEGAAAAQQLSLGAEMNQMLQELESYWFTAADLIPDHLGLVGLADDAYATLFLLQSLSDYCRNTTGRPLLRQDLTSANQGMRAFIGDPVVSILEQKVGVTMANAMVLRILAQAANAGFSFGAGPDPIWGNASIDEIVNVRLGAMGIV